MQSRGVVEARLAKDSGFTMTAYFLMLEQAARVREVGE
jgi:hypothetical protein